MGKSTFLKYLLVCALGAYTAGCKEDSTDGDGSTMAGTGSAAGTGGGMTAGTGGGMMVDDTPPNGDCPQLIGPLDGAYAPKGACCYRTSNTARVDPAAATRTYEFRLNYFLLINHKKTVSPDVLGRAQTDRAENEEQSLLFRFEMPQSGGKVVDGDGKITLGGGKYNCDGTYSFYGDTAAPADGADGNPARWAAPELPAKVTAAKTDKDRVKVIWKDALLAKNRESYIPYLGAGPAYAIDWEGQSQGFDILEWPTAEENANCVGSRKDSLSWKPGGKTMSFARLDANGKDVLDSLNVTFCQLLAFGTAGSKLSCIDTPRCEPGSSMDCPWQRLPDSLCPVTADEKSKWMCHLGTDTNPDNPFKSNCTMDLPANVDPDNGGTSEGQCCDPLGKSTTLPACNAFLNVNEMVAAASEITDARATSVQKSCK